MVNDIAASNHGQTNAGGKLPAKLLLAVMYAWLCLTCASAVPAATPEPPGRAELWNSEQFIVHSDILDRDFLIQVAKPFGERPGKLAAVYVLDGNMLLAAASANATANARKDNEVYAPAYFIGIGYPDQDIDTWSEQRAADLTHKTLKGPMRTGGGEGFAAFLVKELRPAMERRYPIDPARSILAGYSFGGLFTTHVLLHTPEAFSAYLIGAPSMWAEPELIEAAARFHSTRRPIPVFLAIGADEESFMLDGTRRLAAALRRPGNGVRLEEWIMPGENHLTAQPGFFSRAFRFALPVKASTTP